VALATISVERPTGASPSGAGATRERERRKKKKKKKRGGCGDRRTVEALVLL
jgi:hypothetical protein